MQNNKNSPIMIIQSKTSKNYIKIGEIYQFVNQSPVRFQGL